MIFEQPIVKFYETPMQETAQTQMNFLLSKAKKYTWGVPPKKKGQAILTKQLTFNELIIIWG
jgi:hypothetical protein